MQPPDSPPDRRRPIPIPNLLPRRRTRQEYEDDIREREAADAAAAAEINRLTEIRDATRPMLEHYGTSLPHYHAYRMMLNRAMRQLPLYQERDQERARLQREAPLQAIRDANMLRPTLVPMPGVIDITPDTAPFALRGALEQLPIVPPAAPRPESPRPPLAFQPLVFEGAEEESEEEGPGLLEPVGRAPSPAEGQGRRRRK